MHMQVVRGLCAEPAPASATEREKHLYQASNASSHLTSYLLAPHELPPASCSRLLSTHPEPGARGSRVNTTNENGGSHEVRFNLQMQGPGP
jgi:hypothetical protein